MDGLSSGVAVVACLGFFFVALPTEQIYVNFASCILAGACLGFLRYNWPPAKIFMGDAGSLFVGFILAAVALGENYTTVNNLALFTPILILGVPIFDTLLVMAFRMQKGKSIFLGSKDHFALRLEAMGYKRKSIILIAYLISVILSMAAFIITIVKFNNAIMVYLAVGLLAFLFAVKLSFVKVE
jgi:UDP-GlcNAc:undecaprenyl-phosphate GlcNAc-1-phosphate transferase